MDIEERKKHYFWSTVFVLLAFFLFSVLMVVDYRVFGGEGFNKIIVFPAQAFMKFVKSQFINYSEHGEADLLLIGVSIGFYVFVAYLFYRILTRILNKRDLFDVNYHKSATKDKLVLIVIGLIFKNAMICLGLFTLYTILLAFLVKMVFN